MNILLQIQDLIETMEQKKLENQSKGKVNSIIQQEVNKHTTAVYDECITNLKNIMQMNGIVQCIPSACGHCEYYVDELLGTGKFAGLGTCDITGKTVSSSDGVGCREFESKYEEASYPKKDIEPVTTQPLEHEKKIFLCKM